MKRVSRQPCAAHGRRCGSPCDPAHIDAVGAGGGDHPDNVMPLCHALHVEAHQHGWGFMMKEYAGVMLWLLQHGRLDVIEEVAWKEGGYTAETERKIQKLRALYNQHYRKGDDDAVMRD